jgi:hypothetical protein
MKLLSWIFSTITNSIEIFLFILWIAMLSSAFQFQGLFGFIYGLFFGAVIILLRVYFKRKPIEKTPDVDNELTLQDYQEILEKITKNVKNKVSNIIFEKVIKITNNLFMLLRLLDKASLNDYDSHIVRNTITDYLPQTLTSYLELSTDFANSYKIKNGKTSEEILIEQLDILDEQINNIVISTNSKEAEALITHGEFLKSKFANDKNWI